MSDLPSRIDPGSAESKLRTEIAAQLEQGRGALSNIAIAEVLADIYKAEKVLGAVKRAECETEDDYLKLSGWLLKSKESSGTVELRRTAITTPIYSVWKALNAFLGKPGSTYGECVRLLNLKLDGFEQKRAAAAREKEDKIRALQAEEAKRIKEEAEKKALAAEKAGELERAKELRERVELPIPVVVQPAVPPKVEGLRRGETWEAEVEDIMKLEERFIERVPRMKVLNALAKDSKGQNPPAGVRFVKRVLRGRTR